MFYGQVLYDLLDEYKTSSQHPEFEDLEKIIIDLQYVLSEVQRLQGCSPALGPFEAALEGTRVNKFLKDQLRVTQAKCTLTSFFRYPLRHS